MKAISYLGKLSRGHGNFFVNLKTTRNSQSAIFILKVSFFLINVHYKFNILHSVLLIFVFIHSPIRLFVHLIHTIICLSVRPSFLPSFLPSSLPSFFPSFLPFSSSFLLSSNPPLILLTTSRSPINTSWQSAV